jgi:hypothetical protein
MIYQSIQTYSPRFSGITQARFNQALGRAYRAFARRNPEWTDALFDEHFLTHTAARLFAAYYQRGELPSADRLARLWARQLPTIDRAHQAQRITEATAAAHDFLRRLSVELCAHTTNHRTHAASTSAEWAGDAALP